jgi:hypothetical protein
MCGGRRELVDGSGSGARVACESAEIAPSFHARIERIGRFESLHLGELRQLVAEVESKASIERADRKADVRDVVKLHGCVRAPDGEVGRAKSANSC